jgi:hypothetical protein
MASQLRRYRITAGNGPRFAREWARGVAPLRERFGFRVTGWIVDGTDEFVWLLRHDSRASFEAADRAYYASPQRAALDPDPARLIEEARHDWVTQAHPPTQR